MSATRSSQREVGAPKAAAATVAGANFIEPIITPGKLCLECGMCCDGTIFVDVKLSAIDNARIAEHRTWSASEYLPAKSLPQPCPAFIGGKCATYKTRPDHCRNFDCALLQNASSGRLAPDRALLVIKATRKKAEKLRALLRELGDKNEHLALMTRFRRTLRRHETRVCDEATRDCLARLTVAAHNLNRALGRHFYP